VGMHTSLVRRVSIFGAAGVMAVVAGVMVLLSLVASAAVPWAVGALLAGAVVAVVVLGLHAGGHAWFVPVPVLVLGAVWAVTASAGSWTSPLAWTLAALALATAISGGVLVLPALAYRRAAGTDPVVGSGALVGATGTAVTALSPRGIARVNNETWSAESLSGHLRPGAPVHVARVEGVRLLVWSEAGNIPGPEALPEGLNSAHQLQEKEEP